MANGTQSTIKALGQKSKQGAESSSVALTIIVTWLLTDVFGIDVPVEVAVAISTVVGIAAARFRDRFDLDTIHKATINGKQQAEANATQSKTDSQ